MESIKNIENLRERIKDVLDEEISSEDFYCGIIGIEEATDEIMNLLRNNFMLFLDKK